MSQSAPRGAISAQVARGRARRLAGGVALGCALLAGALSPQQAGALWTRIAHHRSATEPYFVCQRGRHRAHCDLIADPIRGVDTRGPLKAGAITAGPEQQASPPLSGKGAEGGYTPQNLREAYGLLSASTSSGYGQTVAVVDAYNDPNAESDLEAYRSAYHLPECTTRDGCFQKVNEDGGSSFPASNGEWSQEISLDLDMVSAICPNCHILLVEASNEETPELATAEDEAVTLGATEISNSYGFEALAEPAYAYAYDHPGIPTTAAAGDSGYGVEWPAASPDVIAVGGTTLEPASNQRGWRESVWSETGSGCSEEPKPSWQKDAGCRHRTNNDVAAVASTDTPVSVYDTYRTGGATWILLGGTSVATPIVASAMALASPYTRTFEGARALYVEAALKGKGTLDDVTIGSNGNCHDYLCEAGTGYDGPTGLGSLEGPPEVPPPAFVTRAASGVGLGDATLNGTVEPNGGEVRECRFEYRAQGAWASAPCSPPPGSGTSAVSVSASLTGLEAGTEYHFRLAGNYPGGSGRGEEKTFTMSSSTSGPSVTTEAASAIGKTSATLNAEVDPHGNSTTCAFEYGTSGAHGATKPCSPSPGSGTSPVAVSAVLSGLTADTTYYFRVTATNREGTREGSERTFKTLPEAPVVWPVSFGAITQHTVQLEATVDPEGAAVISCAFEYGLTASYGTSSACEPPLAEGANPVAVSAPVEGLTAATTYHVRLSVKTASGTAHSGDETFTTLPYAPDVLTEGSSGLTSGSATLNGSVQPNGGALTTCEFQFGSSEADVGDNSAQCTSLPEATEGRTSVSAALSGLHANTTYSYRIVAANAGGTSYGSLRTFTTPPATPSSEGPGSGLESEVGPVSVVSTTPPPAPVASLASTNVSASATGTLALELRCAGSGSCHGTITVRTLNAVAAGGRHSPMRRVTLASGPFTVAAGQLAKVKLRLGASSRSLLAHVHVLTARATIVLLGDTGQQRTSETRVTVHAPRSSSQQRKR